MSKGGQESKLTAMRCASDVTDAGGMRGERGAIGAGCSGVT